MKLNESGAAGIEVVGIFGPNSVCSCLGPQVVHLWIRHGAVVRRIVNIKGLNAYSVTSHLNICAKFGVWLPRTIGGPPSKGKKLCRIYYLFYWVDREGGGGHGSNCNMKFWIVKWENMNESGPAGIEVMRIFGPNSVCSCLGAQVVHLWKGTTTFGPILAL